MDSFPPTSKTLPTGSTLPTGTVTFLFTDIQGSTPLWESQPEKMAQALQIHNTALRTAIQAHGGVIFKFVGDAFQAAFPKALPALKAAIAGQQALAAAHWNELGELKVRMGLHTGEVEIAPDGDDYAVAHTMNRVARIMSTASGGQVLLSQETKDLVERQLPEGVTLKDLGEHRLKGMSYLERLFQVCAPGLVQEFPSLGTSVSHPHNLPVQLTSFVGRDKEMAQVIALLQKNRLVTLTGSGGVGKTRLSIRVAGEMLDDFHDGVWYIELASISDPDRVPQTVVSTLGLREDPNHSLLESLARYLENRQTLLILDNCEHLVGACAKLVDHLLRNAPSVKIFASSREALGISGEIPYSVPSLPTPDPNHLPDLNEFRKYEAVRLFVERARVAAPSFQIEAHNLPAVAQICHRLDGIPLALELAAARLKMLTTAQLASRLDNAFRLLTGGSRSALPRQQTLQAAIDWSYQLLNEKERTLMRRLGVFAGSFNLEGAEQVCAGDGLEDWEVFDLLASLVDKSIVSAERNPGKEMRYRMLETVRQYSLQKLYESGESQAFHDRHLAYFLDLAETIEPQLRTSVALERLSLLTLEAPNLRAALSWAYDSEGPGQIEKGLRLASSLLNYWHTQNFHTEGSEWIVKGFARLPENGENARLRAKACFAAGHLILPLERIQESKKWMKDSLLIHQMIDDQVGIVTAQSMLGEIHAWEGSFEKARELGEASVAQCRKLDDPWLLAWVLCRYGTSLFYQSFNTWSEQAKSLIEESLSIFEEHGDLLQLGDHYIMLGTMELNQGNLTDASAYYHRGLTAARSMQSRWTESNLLYNLARVAYIQGDFHQTQILASQSLFLKREIGRYVLGSTLLLLGFAEMHLGKNRNAVQHFKECLKLHTSNSNPTIVSLVGLAKIALQSSQMLIAAQLLNAAKHLMNSQNVTLGAQFQKDYENAWIEIQNKSNSPEFEKALEAGQVMTLVEAVALAMEVEFE
jgi:predicted ATPase/class 3 adenylate cyclase